MAREPTHSPSVRGRPQLPLRPWLAQIISFTRGPGHKVLDHIGHFRGGFCLIRPLDGAYRMAFIDRPAAGAEVARHFTNAPKSSD